MVELPDTEMQAKPEQKRTRLLMRCCAQLVGKIFCRLLRHRSNVSGVSTLTIINLVLSKFQSRFTFWRHNFARVLRSYMHRVSLTPFKSEIG